MIFYRNRKGDPISMEEWSASFEQDRHVGKDEVKGVRVSTVWLGFDHGFEDGPPLIFETMIFGGEHDQYQDRYSTEEQAMVGHIEACRMVFGEDHTPTFFHPEE